MSDLDISGSIPAKGSSLNASQSSVLTSVCKDGIVKENSEDGDSVNEVGSLRKKEAKIPQSNIDRKELSPCSILNDVFSKKDQKARVVVQANSPVYQVFTPISPKAYIPPKSPFPKDSQLNFTLEPEKKSHMENIFNSGCPEGLITIMPPINSRFSVTATEIKNEMDSNIYIQPDSMFKPSPNTNFSYEDTYPHLTEPVQPPLYPTEISKTSPPSFSFPQTTPAPIQEMYLPSLTEEKSDEKSSGDVGTNQVVETEIKPSDSNIPIPPPLIESVIALPKMEEIESSVPDPTTPSAAIPVPAMSQAHAAPESEIDLGRRPIVHELEPILEHKDEGGSSPGSSLHDISLPDKLTEAQPS